MIKTLEDLYLESKGVRSCYALLCSKQSLVNSFITETRHLLNPNAGYLSQFSKHGLYSQYFPDLETRIKFTGFEKVRRADLEIRKRLREIVTVIASDMQDTYSTDHLSFKEEMHNVLSDIKNPLLYLSGGIDSEFVARWFLEFGIPFETVTISWSYNRCAVNLHDVTYAVKFCKEYGIKYREINLSLEQFWESPRLVDISKSINRTSPQHCAYVMAVEHINSIIENKTHIMAGENRYALVESHALDK